MAMPPQDTRVRPSGLWYLLVVVLWIGSFVIFIVALAPVFSIIGDGVTQVGNRSQVSIPSDGRTIYAENPADNASCSLTDSSGSSTALDPLDTNFDLTIDNGPNVTAIANTPDDLPTGTYLLRCQGVPKASVIATGKRVDVNELGVRFVIGIIASIAAGLIGLIVLIVLLVKRHNSKQRIRQAQQAAAYGYGGYPPGSYPQGGYQQQGYPSAESSGDAPYGTPAPSSSPPPPPPPPYGDTGTDEPQNPPDERR